jgi:hypothetical protein
MADTTSWIETHPWEAAAIGLGGVLVIWYIWSSQSGGTASTPADTSGAAAAVQAAQLAANEQLASVQMQGQVTNNQTAAAQTIALAQTQAQTDQVVAAATAAGQVAGFNAAAEIAGSNSSVAIAQIQGQTAEQLSNNATLSGEYGNLANVLNNYISQAGGGGGVFGNIYDTASASNYFNNSQSTSYSGTQNFGNSLNILGAGTGGYAENNVTTSQTNTQGGGSTSSFTNTFANPNLPTFLTGLNAGLAPLSNNFGSGLAAPSTPSLSETGLLSLAQINSAAVQSVFNLHS